ncbi:MAG: MFS transporter, partial [Myxococcales bacterium]
YSPVEVGAVFVVCGLVMATFQVGAVGFLSGRISELWQTCTGFGTMGAGFALLAITGSKVFVFASVGILALGTALISPNLAGLVSKLGGRGHIGQALGAQNAANSVGQAIGPLIGGALFLLRRDAPYLVTGVLLAVVSAVLGWTAWGRKGLGAAEPTVQESAK